MEQKELDVYVRGRNCVCCMCYQLLNLVSPHAVALYWETHTVAILRFLTDCQTRSLSPPLYSQSTVFVFVLIAWLLVLYGCVCVCVSEACGTVLRGPCQCWCTGFGSVVVINLWMSWSCPCLVDISDMTQIGERILSVPLWCVWLSLLCLQCWAVAVWIVEWSVKVNQT